MVLVGLVGLVVLVVSIVLVLVLIGTLGGRGGDAIALVGSLKEYLKGFYNRTRCLIIHGVACINYYSST